MDDLDRSALAGFDFAVFRCVECSGPVQESAHFTLRGRLLPLEEGGAGERVETLAIRAKCNTCASVSGPLGGGSDA